MMQGSQEAQGKEQQATPENPFGALN